MADAHPRLFKGQVDELIVFCLFAGWIQRGVYPYRSASGAYAVISGAVYRVVVVAAGRERFVVFQAGEAHANAAHVGGIRAVVGFSGNGGGAADADFLLVDAEFSHRHRVQDKIIVPRHADLHRVRPDVHGRVGEQRVGGVVVVQHRKIIHADARLWRYLCRLFGAAVNGIDRRRVVEVRRAGRCLPYALPRQQEFFAVGEDVAACPEAVGERNVEQHGIAAPRVCAEEAHGVHRVVVALHERRYAAVGVIYVDKCHAVHRGGRGAVVVFWRKVDGIDGDGINSSYHIHRGHVGGERRHPAKGDNAVVVVKALDEVGVIVNIVLGGISAYRRIAVGCDA